MRRHDTGRRWGRVTPRVLGRRFRHADRLAAPYLPETSHVQRGLR
ncbi:MAG TPA: hypothetical protein VJM75_11320 [Acidimicrobiales bacterium]|nr:hypothetical protein [Acidimicrobiales bacterium]